MRLPEHKNLKHAPSSKQERGWKILENTIDLHKDITLPALLQLPKHGQAGEGAAGDAGDSIGIEIAAMEMIRDQCLRGRK